MQSFKRPPSLDCLDGRSFGPPRDVTLSRSNSISSPSDSVPVKNTFIDFPAGCVDSGDEHEVLPMNSAPACVGAQRNLSMFKRTINVGAPSRCRGNELPNVMYNLSPQTAQAHGFGQNQDFIRNSLHHRRVSSGSQHPEEETSSTTAADVLPNREESTTTMMNDTRNSDNLFTENSILTAHTDYEWKPYSSIDNNFEYRPTDRADNESELDDFGWYHNNINTTKNQWDPSLRDEPSVTIDEPSAHKKLVRRKMNGEDEPSTQDEPSSSSHHIKNQVAVRKINGEDEPSTQDEPSSSSNPNNYKRPMHVDRSPRGEESTQDDIKGTHGRRTREESTQDESTGDHGRRTREESTQDESTGDHGRRTREESTQDESIGDHGRRTRVETQEETSEKVGMVEKLCHHHHHIRTNLEEDGSFYSDDSDADSIDSEMLGELPSIGSKDHILGTCKRCCFFPKARCTNGFDCQFCHYDHDKRKRKNKKKKKRETPDCHSISLTSRHYSVGKMECTLTRNPIIKSPLLTSTFHDSLLNRDLSRPSIYDNGNRFLTMRNTSTDRLKTIGREVETQRVDPVPQKTFIAEIMKAKEPVLGKSIEKRTPIITPVIPQEPLPSFLDTNGERQRWGDMEEDSPFIIPSPKNFKTSSSSNQENLKSTDESHGVKKDWKNFNTPRVQEERYEEWQGKEHNTEFNGEWTSTNGPFDRLRPLPPIDWCDDDFTTPGYSDYSKDYKAPAHVWSPSRWDKVHKQQTPNNYQTPQQQGDYNFNSF